MSRIRTIKPEFFSSADIVALTPLSRLFYIALWCESDRDGRFVWNVKTLKLRYFPADDCDIQEMADELINACLIQIYHVDGKEYGEIPSFTRHQVINNRESESVLPPRVKDASVTRESGGLGEGRKEGRERKGKELASCDSSFADFWKSYPNKTGKGAAETAWKKIKAPADTLVLIFAALAKQKNSDQWRKDGGQFIPNPATYLNQRRWEDGDSESAKPDMTAEEKTNAFMRRFSGLSA